MDPLLPYSLPLKGLGNGVHHFDFQVDGEFFKAIEGSPIEAAEVAMQVDLDKQPRLLVFDFSFTGTVRAACDRCLADIPLPVEGNNRLLVKYGEPDGVLTDDDVVFIPADTSIWSIADYVYEYIFLAMPMIKMYDCQAEATPPCDQDMLKYILQQEPGSDDDDDDDSGNPLWDALKNWDENPE